MDETVGQNQVPKEKPGLKMEPIQHTSLNDSPTKEKPRVSVPPKISSIRTYQTDAARSVQENKTSLVRMVIAEQGKRDVQLRELSPRSSKNIVLLSLSVILLIAGVLLATFFFVKTLSTTNEDPNNIPRIKTFILTEQDVGVDITSDNREAVWKKTSSVIKNLTPRLDTLVNIYFAETKDYLSQPTIIDTERFFTLLESKIPSTLLRSLDNSFLFGVHSFNGNQPFLILKTNFYENAVAGMYSWENDMAGEILPLFGIAVNGKSTLYEKDFTDAVVKNKDVRMLADNVNQPLLLYYFKDKKTIIITTNEATLSELITRLSVPKSQI